MGAPAKFLFDMDFAAPKTSEPAPSRQEVAQQVADAAEVKVTVTRPTKEKRILVLRKRWIRRIASEARSRQ